MGRQPETASPLLKVSDARERYDRQPCPETWSELLRAIGAADLADEPSKDIALSSGLSAAESS